MKGWRQNENSQSSSASSSPSFLFGLFLQLLYSWISIFIKILDSFLRFSLLISCLKGCFIWWEIPQAKKVRTSHKLSMALQFQYVSEAFEILLNSKLYYLLFQISSIRYHRCEFKLQLPTKTTSVDNSRLVDLSPTFITVRFEFTYNTFLCRLIRPIKCWLF